MSEKQMKILGWVATFMSVMMYVSYFPQIMNNLAGQKGNFIQPLVAAINCSLWVYYGLFKKPFFCKNANICGRTGLPKVLASDSFQGIGLPLRNS